MEAEGVPDKELRGLHRAAPFGWTDFLETAQVY